MKKLLILSIGLLLLAACDKEPVTECSVCTVITSNSSTGTTTTIHNESDEENCDYTLEEFESMIDSYEEFEDIDAELSGIMTGEDITATHTINCK
jgi:hypothetical protein